MWLCYGEDLDVICAKLKRFILDVEDCPLINPPVTESATTSAIESSDLTYIRKVICRIILSNRYPFRTRNECNIVRTGGYKETQEATKYHSYRNLQ